MSDKPKHELVTIIGVLLGRVQLTTTETFQLVSARRILENRPAEKVVSA